ncbi:MAG TPA: helix-turn-helix domain-containing protein [Actinomycetes bacterium]|nr:helix-turn-helix domain-containing protein [Actinomycetes bacterium]
MVRTASTMFAAHGYSAVSVRTIANAVHADVAAIYYYFRSKDALLAAVLAPYLAQQISVTETANAAPRAQRARTLLTGLVDARVTHPEAAAIVNDPAIRDLPRRRAEIEHVNSQATHSLLITTTGRGARQRVELALTLVAHGPVTARSRSHTLDAAVRLIEVV